MDSLPDHLLNNRETLVEVLKAHVTPRDAKGRLAAVSKAWHAWVGRIPDVMRELDAYVSSQPLLQPLMALPYSGLRALFKKRLLPLPEQTRETTRVPAMLRPAALELRLRAFAAETMVLAANGCCPLGVDAAAVQREYKAQAAIKIFDF